MAVVTGDLLSALFTNFRALWEQQFLAAQTKQLKGQLCMIAPSGTLDESYNWLGTVPKMREWIGERQFEGLYSQTYTLRNKDWESSFEVDRNEIEDDRLGLVNPRISQLAAEAVRHQDELALTNLVAGTTGLCYDGQFFFDTDHAEGESGAQSNKLTGTGTTLAQLTADYEAARNAMRRFKDDRGRPMNIEPTHILVPPQLEGRARELINSQFVPSGSVGNVENPWKGTAEILVSSYLSDANDWYLLALNQPVKPLIFQDRKAPEFTALDSPTTETVFKRRKYQYGVDARYNVGYGFWQMAVLTTNT